MLDPTALALFAARAAALVVMVAATAPAAVAQQPSQHETPGSAPPAAAAEPMIAPEPQIESPTVDGAEIRDAETNDAEIGGGDINGAETDGHASDGHDISEPAIEGLVTETTEIVEPEIPEPEIASPEAETETVLPETYEPAGEPSFETATIPPKCGPLIVAEFAWDAAELAAALLERMIRDGYDCAATRLPASPDRALALIGVGVDAPPPAAAGGATLGLLIAPGVSQAKAEAAEGAAVGAALYGGGAQAGWYAPAWLLVLNPRVRSMTDAAQAPELFAAAPGEKPRVHLCPKNWPCGGDNEKVIESLNLDERFEIVEPGSGDALTASLIDAFSRREPWLGYYWTPSETLAEYPMRRLDSGELKFCDDSGGDASDCHAPFAAAPAVTAYSATLAEAQPRLAELLARFTIPQDRAQLTMAWKLANNASIEQAATHLLQTYPDLWRSWLDNAARERLEASLVAEVSERGGDGLSGE